MSTSSSDDETPNKYTDNGKHSDGHESMHSDTNSSSGKEAPQTKSPERSSSRSISPEAIKNIQEEEEDEPMSPETLQDNKENNDDENTHSILKDLSKSRSRSTSKSKRSRSPRKKSRRSHSRSPSRRRSRSHRRSRSNSRKRSRSRSHGRYRRSRSRERRRRSRSRTPIDGARLHVAELDVDTRKRDLEKLFEKYGRLREIWMARNPPCFAFVVYHRQKDADDAMRETDGMVVGHCRIKVTMARPRVRGGRFRGYDPNLRCYQCGELGHFSRNCTDTKFGYKRPPTPPGMCYGMVLW